MSDTLFSPSWYKVEELQPRIRGHGQIHRHHFRGELWYVLQDHSSGRYYRFSPIAYRVIGMMDGNRTVQEIWEDVLKHFGDDAPGQNEIIRLLGQLHAADVLICNVPPDTKELLRRGQRMEGLLLLAKVRSPLFLKIPLIDPESFLQKTSFLFKPLFSFIGAFIWLCVVFAAISQVFLHWSELTTNIVDRVFSAGNFVVLWFVYPVVKAFHELAHGYAVKKWGGEVHEMGIMLLVFMPIPYVDATAASSFRSKWQRALVGAAGIGVELFLAALAVFLWVSMDQGLFRSVVYNVILIGGVSTLLFNGNPLLRYDGYYILSDLLDIPNLAQRSQNYLGYLVNRYVLAVKKVTPPYTGPGEKPWFFFYSIASFIYRLFVYAAIIMFVAGKFFSVGILLAIWGVTTMIILPVTKKTRNLFVSPVYREKRFRTIAIAGSILAILVYGLVFVPFPYLTRVDGVMWVPEQSIVRSKTAGIVSQLLVTNNSPTRQGDVLLVCIDPILEGKIEILHSQIREYELRYKAVYPTDPGLAQIVDKEIKSIRGQLGRAEERFAEMKILSPDDGVFVLPRSEDILGKFVRQGELLGYVLGNNAKTVRLVVPQTDVELIRDKTQEVELRMAWDLKKVISGQLEREVPGAVDRLPSMALGVAGGGEIAMDPADRSGNKTFENMFQFDIALSQPLDELYIGSRVHVRFDHGYEPLAFRWYRSLRQLFLKRFNV